MSQKASQGCWEIVDKKCGTEAQGCVSCLIPLVSLSLEISDCTQSFLLMDLALSNHRTDLRSQERKSPTCKEEGRLEEFVQGKERRHSGE